ncbi:MAG TPA: hypothetical protein VFF57_05545, partial [Hanamia sp.]|nr:hypothetical protein [Hanamia sp.]
MDASFNGLYVNQISNGTRTSFKDLQATSQQIKEEIMQVYNYQKSQTYHPAVTILLIDMNSGASINKYSLPATSSKSTSGSQGNAY